MKKVVVFLTLIAIISTVMAEIKDIAFYSKSFSPPIAKRSDYFFKLNGHTIRDPYHWLKDKTRTNQEIISYIEDENVYTGKMMEHTQKMQRNLYKEMIARLQENDMTLPVKRDIYYYYFRDVKGKEYSIYCRKKDSIDSPEEIILDVNELAENNPYFSVDMMEMSPNHQYLAYSVDKTGAEIYTLYIKDLRTGNLLPDSIYAVSSIEWVNDNKNIYYTTDNLDLNYTDKLYRHTLGDDQSSDELIMHEKDGRYYVWIYKTKDKKFFIAGSSSKTTDEISFSNADDARSSFQLIRQRTPDIRYSISHRGDNFYILTNDNAPNYRIVEAPVSNPGYENWKDYIPTSSKNYISSFEMFEDYMIVHEIKNGQLRMHVYNNTNNKDYYIEFDDPTYSYSTHGNVNFDSNILRYSYESFTTPEIVYEYNLDTKQQVIKKQRLIPSGYHPEQYKSERIFAIAEDGTSIPISLVYKKNKFKQDGSNPLLLEGYGSYGDNNSPYFSSSRLTLLDRGFVYAVAHIRGGGENGDSWYEQGKMLKKKTTFTDFIACAEELIESNFTSSEKLIIQGGSAGGLLIGAVLNQRPDICKAAIADVPFVDIVNTMLDTTLVATVSEYEEWGNPADPAYFDYIYSYCPYTNVRVQSYPNILAIAGFYDPRVNYWEPAKWVSKLRYCKTDNNVILLRTNMSGHQGASGRYKYFEELAFEYAFMFDILGITK
ncbi:MAG: S9 family peptidase [Candidatus Cloacimonetes bacterium]|nr:S9 family peptidase [Candidatus Cloacimonadota bacterium]